MNLFSFIQLQLLHCESIEMYVQEMNAVCAANVDVCAWDMCVHETERKCMVCIEELYEMY